jgi:hypothetical protein
MKNAKTYDTQIEAMFTFLTFVTSIVQVWELGGGSLCSTSKCFSIFFKLNSISTSRDTQMYFTTSASTSIIPQVSIRVFFSNNSCNFLCLLCLARCVGWYGIGFVRQILHEKGGIASTPFLLDSCTIVNISLTRIIWRPKLQTSTTQRKCVDDTPYDMADPKENNDMIKEVHHQRVITCFHSMAWLISKRTAIRWKKQWFVSYFNSSEHGMADLEENNDTMIVIMDWNF